MKPVTRLILGLLAVLCFSVSAQNGTVVRVDIQLNKPQDGYNCGGKPWRKVVHPYGTCETNSSSIWTCDFNSTCWWNLQYDRQDSQCKGKLKASFARVCDHCYNDIRTSFMYKGCSEGQIVLYSYDQLFCVGKPSKDPQLTNRCVGNSADGFGKMIAGPCHTAAQKQFSGANCTSDWTGINRYPADTCQLGPTAFYEYQCHP